MSEPLRKVQSGQRLRIPAAAYNAFVDAARDLRSRQQSQSQQLAVSQPEAVVTVRVKNTSVSDVARFGVLGIDQPLFTPTANIEEFKNRVVLQCSSPSVASHTGKFVIAAEPIASGQIGTAFITGVCVAKVEITSANDVYADVKASAAELKTGSSGLAQILWKESGTGTGKWAIVRLGGGSSGKGGSLQQFKIKSSASSGQIAVCGTWDGVTLGPDTNVRVVSHRAANEILLAGQRLDDTSWQEVTTNCLFPVVLTQSGGSAGSKTSKCSFTYTVKDIGGGITLGTGISPVQQVDYNNARRTAATIGMAYIHTDGTVKIFCIEDRTTGGC
jgi:hypothetical protein